MAHARTLLRQAFVEALKGNTAAAGHVYDSRLYTLEEAALPAIIVFSSNEEVLTGTISFPRSQDRTVRINVECYAKATIEVNVTIDNMAAETEQLVLSSKALKKLCKDCKLESTNISINIDGDQPVAIASLVFAVNYRTREDTPEAII